MQAAGDSTRKLRLRVCNFLKLWVSSYWEPSDEPLEVEYRTFVERVRALSVAVDVSCTRYATNGILDCCTGAKLAAADGHASEGPRSP